MATTAEKFGIDLPRRSRTQPIAGQEGGAITGSRRRPSLEDSPTFQKFTSTARQSRPAPIAATPSATAPTEEPSFFDNLGEGISNFGSGVGQGLREFGQGIGQLGTQAGEALGIADEGATEQFNREVRQQRQGFEKEFGESTAADVGKFAGEVAPFFAPGLGLVLRGTKTAASIGNAALAGAGAGLAFADPEKDESRLQRALIAAPLGAVANPLVAGLRKAGGAAASGVGLSGLARRTGLTRPPQGSPTTQLIDPATGQPTAALTDALKRTGSLPSVGRTTPPTSKELAEQGISARSIQEAEALTGQRLTPAEAVRFAGAEDFGRTVNSEFRLTTGRTTQQVEDLATDRMGELEKVMRELDVRNQAVIGKRFAKLAGRIDGEIVSPGARGQLSREVLEAASDAQAAKTEAAYQKVKQRLGSGKNFNFKTLIKQLEDSATSKPIAPTLTAVELQLTKMQDAALKRTGLVQRLQARGDTPAQIKAAIARARPNLRFDAQETENMRRFISTAKADAATPSDARLMREMRDAIDADFSNGLGGVRGFDDARKEANRGFERYTDKKKAPTIIWKSLNGEISDEDLIRKIAGKSTKGFSALDLKQARRVMGFDSDGWRNIQSGVIDEWFQKSLGATPKIVDGIPFVNGNLLEKAIKDMGIDRFNVLFPRRADRGAIRQLVRNAKLITPDKAGKLPNVPEAKINQFMKMLVSSPILLLRTGKLGVPIHILSKMHLLNKDIPRQIAAERSVQAIQTIQQRREALVNSLSRTPEIRPGTAGTIGNLGADFADQF